MNLVISIFLILFSIQAFCQIAQPDRIIFLKWGKSSTEIGYQIQDQMPFGPKYFDLDNDENIYISDDLNKKLKKFNKKGILLFQIPAENYPGQIDVLDDHTIILNDGNELKKFDKKGNLMREINVMEVPGLGMVKADHNNKYIFLTNFEGTTFILNYNLEVQDKLIPDNLPHSNYILFHGRIYLLDFRSHAKLFTIKHVEYQKGINIAHAFSNARTLRITQAQNAFIALEGADEIGNFYISILTGKNNPYVIKKYTKQGEKIGEIQLLRKSVLQTHDPFKISADGDLYVLSSDKTGLWIDKYPALLFEKQ